MSRIASIDSSLAGLMKLQVLTTSTSADSGSSTTSWPRRASTPSITSLSTWFFGQPRVRRWTRLVTEVGELDGDPEVVPAEALDHGLEIVLLLAGDPYLVALDGDLDLQLRVLHQLHHLARLLHRDSLLQGDLLLRTARRSGLDRPGLQRPERHLAPRQLLLQHLVQQAQLELVGRTEVEGVLLAADLRRRVAEVEALADFLEGLLDRIIDFLQVDATHHIEERHGGPSIGRRTNHVSPGRGREPEETRIERDVALLVGEDETRGRPQRIGDAGLFQRRVRLAHYQHERPQPLVAVGDETEHPALGAILVQAGREVTLEPSQAREKGNRGVGVERLAERRLDHLVVVGLVDPERFSVADDQLRIGRLVVPAHVIRLLEGERAGRFERTREGRGLDDLVEVSRERAGRLVACLEPMESVAERFRPDRRHCPGDK